VAATGPNPIRCPLAVRVVTDDPLLVGLPWRRTRWHGYRLTEQGWRFALSGPDLSERDVTLPVPARVVVVVPAADAADGRVAGLRAVLRDLWGGGDDPGYLRVGHTPDQLQDTLAGMRPALLLLLADVAGTAQLAEALRDRPPLCVYTDAWRPAACPPAPPLLVMRRLPRPEDDPGAELVAWLRRWFGEGLDPVEALHGMAAPDEAGADTLVVRADYRHWQTSTYVAPSRADLPRLRLDRDKQRALVRKHVSDLAQSRTRRVEALVAYGEAGNRVEDHRKQLADYLELELRHVARLRYVPLRFPADRSHLRHDLEEAFTVDLAREGERLDEALHRLAPRAGRGRAVIWLDWGVFGPGQDHQAPLDTETLATGRADAISHTAPATSPANDPTQAAPATPSAAVASNPSANPQTAPTASPTDTASQRPRPATPSGRGTTVAATSTGPDDTPRARGSGRRPACRRSRTDGAAPRGAPGLVVMAQLPLLPAQVAGLRQLAAYARSPQLVAWQPGRTWYRRERPCPLPCALRCAGGHWLRRIRPPR